MKENKNELFGIEITNNVEENVEIIKETKEVKANKNLKISDTLTFENDDDTTIKKFIKQFIDEDTQDDNMNLIIKECMDNLSRLDIGKVDEKITFFITSYIAPEIKKLGTSSQSGILSMMGTYSGGINNGLNSQSSRFSHTFRAPGSYQINSNTGTINNSNDNERAIFDIISLYIYYITLDKIHNGFVLKVYIGDKEDIKEEFCLYKKEEINSLLESLFEMIKNVLKVRQESETLLDDFFGEI